MNDMLINTKKWEWMKFDISGVEKRKIPFASEGSAQSSNQQQK